MYDKDPVLIMEDFYGMMYGFLAKRVIDSFGEEGEQVVAAATDADRLISAIRSW